MSPIAKPLRDEGSKLQVVTAGAVAGLISRFCIAPLDVLKIRLQLSYHSLSDPLDSSVNRHQPNRTRVWTVARDILKNEGITGFWKGNIPAEGLYLSYGAVQFLTYRSATQVLEALSRDEQGHAQLRGSTLSFVSGAIAGTAATTATYPLDLLRTRFAAQGTDRVYAGLIASIREITKHEGYAGFFRGLPAGIGQIVPYMGLFFALYETFKPILAEVHLPFSSGDAVAGISASVLSKSAVFPLDTVRKRLQIQGPGRTRFVGGLKMPSYEKGVAKTLATIIKREGWRGLYRGLSVSLFKAAPTSAITMWSYERFMGIIRQVE
ncbi:mitochondrial thiamine pyrophosphate carrier 1 [Polychaeton citri CBS 116435]|uniref:Mitochondrial thiamine pyrophosphate carrier 1 n=1 Tax=Polychaeton citri CBS 116435 TaxID=1314669 RepID=A0A9P4UQF6_9PEZI|nr:mitochondrial thiamine pyrophosphate carrier 1 [Polychaeton citri CBS 116435]